MSANDARWQRVNALFDAAVACASDERDAFLAGECGDDADLRREVQSLLDAHRAGETLIHTATVRVGLRIGEYEVTGFIAKGGMGEVYRARDRRLERDVALKILPAAFVADRDRRARFEREARVLASLNHPYIATIHGLEESGGVRALVMELVEGEDLSQRIARGAIPLDEALRIAKQVADALEAAHEQGIIHRDLKPANIKVRSDGTVKVLDFGLAKAMAPAPGSSPNLSPSPTITTPALTQSGMILGTAAYMSPEQAKGLQTDERSDVWAFGAVVYEMLTGRRAFEGEDTVDVLSRVLQREPDWTALPAGVSPTLVLYLKRCLYKDSKQRLGDIHDMRLALEGAFDTTASQTTASATASVPRTRLAWMAIFALAVIALAAISARYLRGTPAPTPPETRTEIVTGATNDPTSFALSPDGKQIVFVAAGDGASRLWLRSLATTTAQSLSGTEGATAPFWSPDGRSIGFFADNALKRLDFGGAVRVLTPVNGGSGGSWNADGVILVAHGNTTTLVRVPASGGGRGAPVTTLGPQHQGHSAPHFLPDGRRFLFSVRGTADTTGIYLGALDGSAPTRLTSAASPGVYLHAGWLLWIRAGTLVAQRLDVPRATLTGEPVVVADEVDAVSAADMGLVAYRRGAGTKRQLTWVGRSGTAQGTVGDPDSNNLTHPRVSPDGQRVVVARTVEGNRDLWLLDGARMSRLTFDAAVDQMPQWSPDGTQIVFRSSRTGVGDLYEKLTNGGGAERLLVASDQLKSPTSWSADGRFLMYTSFAGGGNGDLWVVPMEGPRAPSLLLKTPFRELYGVFSPDGRWVAYTSNESGRMEIYVRPFVPPGGAGTATGAQWQVSTAGGIFPVWRPDGKELYYLNPAGAMVAAPITVTGATLMPGAPVVLFRTRILGGGVEAQQGRQYDVGPDGRFLINTELDSADAPITLLQNWNPETKK